MLGSLVGIFGEVAQLAVGTVAWTHFSLLFQRMLLQFVAGREDPRSRGPVRVSALGRASAGPAGPEWVRARDGGRGL